MHPLPGRRADERPHSAVGGLIERALRPAMPVRRLPVPLLVVVVLAGMTMAPTAPQLLWTDVYNPGRAGRADVGGVARLGPRVFVAAGVAHEERANADWIVRAYRAGTGELLWEDFDLSAREAVAVVAARGRVHVLGVANAGRGDRNWIVRTYRAGSGRVLWERRFDRAGRTDLPTRLAFEGGVLVVAGTSRAGSRADFHVRALRPNSGTLLWEHVFDNDGRNDFLHDLAAAAGRVHVVGESAGRDGTADLLVRTLRSSDGKLLWSDLARPVRNSRGLAVAADGKFVAVVGQGVDIAASRQVGLARVYRGGTGRLVWSDSFADADNGITGAGARSRGFHDVAIAGNRVVAAGDGFPSQGDSDLLVRAFRTRAGDVAWEDRITEADAVAERLIVERGRVYVAGNTDTGSGFGEDLLIRAYRVGNGRLLWEDRHDERGSDAAGAIVLAGNRLVVAGTARRSAPVIHDDQGPFEQDVVVRAYRARGAKSER